MKKLHYKILARWLGMICACVLSSGAWAEMPITTDSRIKTFVYNENEVYHLTLEYGFQSNIEFAKNEEIETISLGNSYSWKITPVDRHLFIKPLEAAAFTNMTIITNKRTYQFELESKDPSENLDEELVYVVRFFIPTEGLDQPVPKINSQAFAPQAARMEEPVMPMSPLAPISAEPMLGAPIAGELPLEPTGAQPFNFNYSLTGPDSIAPIKVFDDGSRTFLKFPNQNAVLPHFFVVENNGAEDQTKYAREGEYIVIKKTFKKMALRLNQDVVYVYNES